MQTRFYKLLDRHQNTIRINVTLPSTEEVDEYMKSQHENYLRRQLMSLTLSSRSLPTCNDKARVFHSVDDGASHTVADLELKQLSLQGCHSDPSVYHSCQDESPTGAWEGRSVSPVGAGGSSSQDTSTSAEFSLNANYSSNQDSGPSTSSPDDLQHFSDEKGPASAGEGHSDSEQVSPLGPDDPAGGSVPGEQSASKVLSSESENWELEVGDTAETCTRTRPIEWEEEEEIHRYFSAVFNDYETSENNQRSLTVLVDKRITLGSFKRELEAFVGTTSENFKVYRVYSNNQEFESIRLSDSLSFLEDGKLNIKMGRALRPGEHRVKVYQLLVNEPEPCKFLVETVFAKGMSVLESKKLILPEIRDQCSLDIPLDRCRLRKKTWKNPGTVYIDSQVYEDEIALFPNWEVFLEVLEGSEQMTVMSQLAIYVRRWRPSLYEIDPFQEVVLNLQTVEELKMKIGELSGIPVENVEFAKGKGTFPCEISVLEIHTDLDWNPQVTTLNVWPLYICDDGHVIFYRDRAEDLAELTEERKKEIQQKENVRISRVSQKLTYSPRKERALKIYTDDSPPPSSSSKSYPDVE